MHDFSIAAVAVSLAVLLPGSAAAATCDTYAQEAAAKAQWVRTVGCGYALDDPRWTTDRKAHARWCKAQPASTVAQAAARRRGLTKLCQTCRAYADLAVASASANTKLKCGMSGPRWGDRAENHFGWCMAQRGSEDATTADSVKSSGTGAAGLPKVVRSETGARAQAVELCKLSRNRAARRSAH